MWFQDSSKKINSQHFLWFQGSSTNQQSAIIRISPLPLLHAISHMCFPTVLFIDVAHVCPCLHGIILSANVFRQCIRMAFLAEKEHGIYDREWRKKAGLEAHNG